MFATLRCVETLKNSCRLNALNFVRNEVKYSIRKNKVLTSISDKFVSNNFFFPYSHLEDDGIHKRSLSNTIVIFK